VSLALRGETITVLLRKGGEKMNGVTLTINDKAKGVAMTQDFTFECHSSERLAEIVESTIHAMPESARLTRIIVA
jgi:hypothetical protein